MDVEGCWFRHDAPVPSALASAHRKILQVLRYWQTIRPANGGVPGRRALDPIAIPDLLPHLWLLDVVREPALRYRYRLVGGALVDAGLGVKRGDYFEVATRSPDVPGLLGILNRVSEEGCIDWRRGPPAIDHSRYIAKLERILLPLSTDGQVVDVVLGCTVFYWTDGRVY